MALFAIRTLGLLQPGGEIVPGPGRLSAAMRRSPALSAGIEATAPEVLAEEPPRAPDELPPVEALEGAVDSPLPVPFAAEAATAPLQGGLESPEPSHEWALQGLRGHEVGGQLVLELSAGEPIQDFRSFTLEDPRRIVIDLPGDWTVRIPEVIDLGHYLASRVRVGQHAEKVRLVIDVGLDTDPQPQIESSVRGLSVRLSPVSLQPLPR